MKHYKRSACLNTFRINVWFNKGELMKKLLLIGLGLVMLMASFGYAADEPAKAPTGAPVPPVAGSETVVLGVTVTELTNVVNGWSVKQKVLGKTVYNDKKEKVGKVDDIIIAPDKVVTYAIIGAGGFLGMDKHDVAIPIKQFKVVDGKFTLPDATKDAIKKMPAFKYAK
jgi:sporulation protein YlmC with PRC-barrel domain